jgi:chemotaxis protein CheY-P-specific phosphatase CheC
MDAMCKARWKVAGIRFISGASPDIAAIMDPSYARQVTSVQMLLAKDIPAVCLVLISRQGAQQITRLLAQNQHGDTGPDVTHLVLTEWANILLTAILDAFANILGSARATTTPSLVEWPPEEVLPRSIKELSDLPERSALVRVQYSCEGLGADCETLFIFRADSMSRLLRVNA